jgi:hypothetical protein
MSHCKQCSNVKVFRVHVIYSTKRKAQLHAGLFCTKKNYFFFLPPFIGTSSDGIGFLDLPMVISLTWGESKESPTLSGFLTGGLVFSFSV